MTGNAKLHGKGDMDKKTIVTVIQMVTCYRRYSLATIVDIHAKLLGSRDDYTTIETGVDEKDHEFAEDGASRTWLSVWGSGVSG